MNVKETKAEGLKREFKITIPAKEIQENIDKNLQNIGRTAKIPGFRPGKIPPTILKQRYGESVQGDALEKAAQENVFKMLKDKNLRAAMRPEVRLSDYSEGKDLECNVSFEIMPDIKTPEYSKFKIERLVTEVSAEEINKAKSDLAYSFAKTEEVKENRPVKEGDLLSVDLKTFVEDQEITQASTKDYLMEVGKKSLPEGVEKALLGKKVGETISVDVTFPKEADPRYAGKKGKYEIVLNNLRQRIPVNLDEALAKEIGYQDLKDLDADIKKRLTAKYIEESFIYTKRCVLDELAKASHFEVPQSMVEAEFNSIWQQLQRNLSGKGSQPLEKKEEEKLKKEYREIAERRVRLGLMLGEIGRANKIEVPEKMVHQELATRAREYPGKEKQVIDFYMKNKEAMASLRAPIFENLVIQHIVDKAEVKERKLSPEQLMKEVEKIVSEDEA